MKRTCSLLAAVLVTTLAACTSLEPNVAMVPVTGYDLVDKSKIDPVIYDKDYAECAAIANQDINSMSTTASRAVGTAAEKVSMGIIGRKPANDADRMSVLKRCLAGRGYNILR